MCLYFISFSSLTPFNCVPYETIGGAIVISFFVRAIPAQGAPCFSTLGLIWCQPHLMSLISMLIQQQHDLSTLPLILSFCVACLFIKTKSVPTVSGAVTELLSTCTWVCWLHCERDNFLEAILIENAKAPEPRQILGLNFALLFSRVV